MASRSCCLSRWKGEAFRLNISRAPAALAWAIGSGNQMSSQMVTATGTPLISTTQGWSPASK
ncbi:hypothetical protein D3C77_663510 [compost metagenome]